MVKKKSTTGHRRKKSNTSGTNKEQQQHRAAKRPKTVSDARNRLADAIKAMIDSIDEEHLWHGLILGVSKLVPLSKNLFEFFPS